MFKISRFVYLVALSLNFHNLSFAAQSLSSPRSPTQLSYRLRHALQSIPPGMRPTIVNFLDSDSTNVKSLYDALSKIKPDFTANETGEVISFPRAFEQRMDSPRDDEDRYLIVEKLWGLRAVFGKLTFPGPAAQISPILKEVKDPLPAGFNDRLLNFGKTIAASFPTTKVTDEGLGEETVLAPKAKVIPNKLHKSVISTDQLNARMKVAFDSMPGPWRLTLDKAYRTSFEMQSDSKHGLSLEQIYGQWHQFGSDHTKTLIELGARETTDKTGNFIIRFPPDWTTIFYRYAQKPHTIYPALVFVKKQKRFGFRLSRTAPKQEYRLVRPGLDEWPDEAQWDVLPENESMPNRLYFEQLADGKIPFSFLPVDHSLAHMTELHENKLIEEKTLAYAKVRVASPWTKEDEEGLSSLYLRGYIISEHLSLPDIRKSELIRKTIPRLFLPQGFKDVATEKEYLKQMNSAERRMYIQELLKIGQSLVLRHGGASRGAYNDGKYFPKDFVYKTISWRVRRSSQYEWSPQYLSGELQEGESVNHKLTRETLDGLLREIDVIFELLRNQVTMRQQHPDEDIFKIPARDLEFRLLTMLCDRVARFEAALYYAVTLNLTNEDFYRQAYLDTPKSDSKIAQYIEAVYPEGSLYRKAFLPSRR